VCKAIFRKELATNGAGRIYSEASGEVNEGFFEKWRMGISGTKR
jgi:hypothetical protein